MFVRLRMLVALVASLTAASALAQSEQLFSVVGVAKGDVLNMRAEPNGDARVVGRIPRSASGIVRIGDCNDWCHVRYDGKVGWVSRRHIAEIPTRATREPPVPVSIDPVGDCNSEDTPRRLAGCSALINSGDLPSPALAIAYSRRSDAHLDLGKLDAALVDRTKAAELAPDDTASGLRLSRVHLQRAASWPLSGKLDAALKDYSDAIRVDPANHEAYAGRSSAYVLKDDYDNAITDLRSALAHHHGQKTVYEAALARLCERRGIQHLLEKELDQAITRFTEAIALNASRDELYVHRASAYGLNGETELALKGYSEAIRINSDNVEAYIGRGELHRRRGALTEALTNFDEAIKRQPSHFAALMFRGLTREDTRDSDGAIADYQAVLKLDATHRFAKAGLERLRAHAAVSTGEAAAPSASSKKKAGERTKSQAKQECFVFNGQTFCN